MEQRVNPIYHFVKHYDLCPFCEFAVKIMAALKRVPEQHGLPVPTRFYISDDLKTIHVRDLTGKMRPVFELETPYKINPQNVSGGDHAE